MENTTKKCPYCGEEILATAIKCKHCKEFLEDNPQKTSWNPMLKGLACFYGVVIILAFLCVAKTPSETNKTVKKEAPVKVETAKVQEPQTNKISEVKGDYSGFGKWATINANFGGQFAKCQKRGVGESLVEQIEYFFKNVSPYRRPEFYKIKEHNPNLRFLVTNPVWAENKSFPNACKADVKFENIRSDTVMGYSYGEPYTVDNSYCRITYTVSEQGEKHRADVINMFCTPTGGYR